jgi:hypothetical protein
MGFDLGAIFERILETLIGLISVPFRIINNSLIVKSVLLFILVLIAIGLLLWILKNRESWKERVY